MARTHFFNNTDGNSLFAKLRGIAQNMPNFDRFLAVVGFFRSSGYFKLRKELEGGDGKDVEEIKILVGINIDDIFRRHNKALLFLSDEEKAMSIYEQDFVEDIKNARYTPEVEEGIMTMIQDIADGRLQMRIHASKNLHAKFYLCLPNNHNENTDGWVIMGSSNISDSGLGLTQPPRYELNVSMKDFEDVDFCHEEFKRLWEEGVPLTLDDIDAFKKKTYLGYQPTPYELFIKVLIDAFGDQVEDDFTIQLPDGVKDLKYQKDAVIQGYQMLLDHNGCFLADVVGLGKTMIATMIAKRYIEANGRNTSILVVYPPALEDNWKSTFKLFGIKKHAQFITNGSLNKILEGKDQYKDKEEFDLIIVDEAHGFRSDSANKYDELQKICKSPCCNPGLLRSTQKRVMLLSATPLNNRPEDLLNQLLLFQNSQSCTIDGVPNLKAFFTPIITDYKKLMKERETRNVTDDVDKLYDNIRKKVIDKVTVRRTRNNILNDPDYCNDIQEQGIVFPNIFPPVPLEYKMDEDTSKRFFETLATLSDEENPKHLEYARYRAIEFLKPEFRARFGNAVHVAQTLAAIYRVHMVKRLESSFYAFKKSLATLLRITQDMIKMFEEDKVVIAPKLNVKDLMMKDLELDEIIEFAISKGYNESEFLFKADDFDPSFREMLENDVKLLKVLNEDWAKENEDPKFDEFKAHLMPDFLDKDKNPEEKLVIFSESVDTLTYLYGRLTEELGRNDVLMVTAKNRNDMKERIKHNFDANDSTDSREYNIIITSDVLAEGVNLHRSNVIINYDSPWNATRLMQRIGRVNRIGSKAENIYNYMFYPSKQGDHEIQLYANALVKLQGFHSAFGEDAQIYSKEEIVRQFEIFDSKVKDSVDKKIALLREVRELYNSDRKLYHKIKALPMKSRVLRDNKKRAGQTIVFVSSNVKTEFYLAEENNVHIIDFLDAVDYLRAKPEEKALPFTNEEAHYKNVNKALEKYVRDFVEVADTNTVVRTDLDKVSLEANNFLRTVKQISQDATLKKHCDTLMAFVTAGVYQKLPRYIRELAREYKNDRAKMKQDEFVLQSKLDTLVSEYNTQDKYKEGNQVAIGDPQIIISESFI
ncbi:helicase-related protein [uncultured Porphyromonas sp.]|uniref:helicase-related protein n=1 Tax=uncultured Porphyromonas sp. TaxID=159274 RepID=UPI002804E7B6|nr:helicase-related protein [uncultured Porphyromonas sp.]